MNKEDNNIRELELSRKLDKNRVGSSGNHYVFGL